MAGKQQTFAEMASDLLLGKYPRFVYGLRAGRREAPPVLCFHRAIPEPFESLLRYLAENRYTTLTCDEFLEHLAGRRPAPPRSVLLTFDDGVGSMWSVAYPLLARYGQKIAVFLIPGRIQDSPGVDLPTLADVWAGRALLEDVVGRDRSEQPLATWQEIRRMHDSGFFDFQSHTTWHDLVITGSEITGFVTPQMLRGGHPHDLLMYEVSRAPGRSYPLPRPGAPLYDAQPRLLGHPGLPEDVGLRHALEEHVAAAGGDEFFAHAGWREVLGSLAERYRAQRPQERVARTETERDAAVREDLAASRRMIEERLPGKRVRHLAFPWGAGSDFAVAAARAAGFECCYWGKVSGRVRNGVGEDPCFVARIGEDFAPLLLGKGRANLGGVLWRKLRRRVTRAIGE